MTFRAFASEFPNDNPELHDGTRWICPELLSAPKPLRTATGGLIQMQFERPSERKRARIQPKPLAKTSPPPTASMPAPVPVPVLEASLPPVAPVIVPELPGPHPPKKSEAKDTVVATPVDAPPDAFCDFVRAMVRVALSQSGTRAAAVLPNLLEHGMLPQSALPEETWRVLAKRGLVTGHAPSLEFMATATAWRDVLRGESADLTACGQNTLDRWAAELLAALLAVPVQRAEELRRELRRSGVAAFGMLAAA